MTPTQLKELPAAELVARIGAGDQEAEGWLVSKYWSGVVLTLEMRGATPDEALDLAQEACWRTILRLRESPIDEPEKLSAFLRSMAKNLHNNDWRKAERRQTDCDSDNIERYRDKTSETLATLLQEESRQAVRLLIGRIEHQRYRELLRRHYVQNETKAEICASMKIESRAYDKGISRARSALRKLVDTLDPAYRSVFQPWKLETE